MDVREAERIKRGTRIAPADGSDQHIGDLRSRERAGPEQFKVHFIIIHCSDEAGDGPPDLRHVVWDDRIRITGSREMITIGHVRNNMNARACEAKFLGQVGRGDEDEIGRLK